MEKKNLVAGGNTKITQGKCSLFACICSAHAFQFVHIFLEHIGSPATHIHTNMRTHRRKTQRMLMLCIKHLELVHSLYSSLYRNDQYFYRHPIERQKWMDAFCEIHLLDGPRIQYQCVCDVRTYTEGYTTRMRVNWKNDLGGGGEGGDDVKCSTYRCVHTTYCSRTSVHRLLYRMDLVYITKLCDAPLFFFLPMYTVSFFVSIHIFFFF